MMCLDVETMIDRIEHGKLPGGGIAIRPLIEGTCLVMIEAAGLAANIVLVVLGLPLFVFLLTAGWDLALLFAQLGNLAAHYEDAEPLARLVFSRDLQFTFVLLVGCLTLLRLPAFLRRLARRLSEGDGSDA
jgi:hypothetical protein